MEKEIEKLIEILQSPVKNISMDKNGTIVEFENGNIIPLFGGGVEIDVPIPKCSICGNDNIGVEQTNPLFTINDESYICLKCTVFALETFMKNGFEINLNIGEFPDLIKQINKLSENLNQKSELK